MLQRFPILGERRTQLAGSLSGGEQQMLAIARGLLAKPRLLMLDEPSLGLAPIIVREVRAIIGSVRDRFDAAVLLVEQNAGLALSIAERGYVMQTGEILGSGRIEELHDSELMRQAYLGERSRAPMP
jgi:branched-chain amino acid transport system ATP-binding protein